MKSAAAEEENKVQKERSKGMNENEKALHAAVKGTVKKAAAHSLAFTLALGFAFLAQSGQVSAGSLADTAAGNGVNREAVLPLEEGSGTIADQTEIGIAHV